jgi:hypothetical protein
MGPNNTSVSYSYYKHNTFYSDYKPTCGIQLRSQLNPPNCKKKIAEMSAGAFISNHSKNIYDCGQKRTVHWITAGNINTPKFDTLSILFIYEKKT